jgi:hypothetical protein
MIMSSSIAAQLLRWRGVPLLEHANKAVGAMRPRPYFAPRAH